MRPLVAFVQKDPTRINGGTTRTDKSGREIASMAVLRRVQVKHQLPVLTAAVKYALSNLATVILPLVSTSTNPMSLTDVYN